MRTFDKGQVVENELSFDEVVEDYCELAVIESESKKLMDGHRIRLIDEYDSRGITVHSSNGRILEVRKTARRKVNIEELEKVCKKKNVEVGKVYYTIRPKNSNIPQKVLESLDKYFVLETNLEVDVKDVQKAVDTGLITQKDYEKMVEENKSSALYPKVEEGERAKIIMD